jgi:hypothetical protein
VGIFEGVRAGQFEGAVEGAQAAFELRQRLGADAAEIHWRKLPKPLTL